MCKFKLIINCEIILCWIRGVFYLPFRNHKKTKLQGVERVDSRTFSPKSKGSDQRLSVHKSV